MKRKIISVFGSYGANNAGDNAILYSTIKSIACHIPEVDFLVLTSRPDLYAEDLKPFSVKFLRKGPTPKGETPSVIRNIVILEKLYRLRHGIGFFSYNSLYLILKSDAVIMCGGLFFDYKLFNPFFNFIFPLYFLVPIARKMNKYLMPFNAGLGPVKTSQGRKMLRRILSSCDLIALREHEGMDFIRENRINVPVYLGADPAINDDPIPKECAMQLLIKEGLDLSRPIVGINITSYIDRWVVGRKKRLTEKEFIQIVSGAVKRIMIREDIQPVMFCTNYMDLEIIKELRDAIDPETVIIDNYKYNHHQLMGITGCMELLVGMRLHACILAIAMGVPVVSINYAPKVKHFSEIAGMGNYANDIETLNSIDLENRLFMAWRVRQGLKDEIERRLPDLKRKASYPAVMLRDLLHGKPVDTGGLVE